MNHDTATIEITTAIAAHLGDHCTAEEVQEIFDLELVVSGAYSVKDGNYTRTADIGQLLVILAKSHKSGLSSEVKCPSWCTLERGHKYDPAMARNDLFRIHEKIIGKSGRIGVEISQGENAASVTGPIEYQPTSAQIVFSGNVLDADLNAEECRKLAALLNEAADVLDHTPSS